MAAATETARGTGTDVGVGRRRSIITTNETNVLKDTDGKLGSVYVANVGTTATIDIYDTAGADTNNKVFEWVTADGKGPFTLQIPMAFGIRVITGGTFGRAVIVWS